MPKYVIEREISGLSELGPDDLHGLAAKSNSVLHDMEGNIQWVQSYATGDRLFCIYNAESEALIQEHARRGGFPCDSVRQVHAVIDPVTGEG